MGSVGNKIASGFKDVFGGAVDFTLNPLGDIREVVKGVTGITAAEQAEKAADFAKKTAAEQKAEIAKQEKLIEDQRRLQERVAAERTGRLAQNSLLSGSETGGTKTSLLARS